MVAMYVLSGCESPLIFVVMMLEAIAGMVICLVEQMVFILFVGKLDLPRVEIVDQLVAVHEVDANNVVIQLVDNVHWVGELLPFDI